MKPGIAGLLLLWATFRLKGYLAGQVGAVPFNARALPAR
jgi:hypothetical protein